MTADLFRGSFKECKEPSSDSGVPVEIKTVVTFFDNIEVVRLVSKGHSTTKYGIPKKAKAYLREKSSHIFYQVEEDEVEEE